MPDPTLAETGRGIGKVGSLIVNKFITGISNFSYNYGFVDSETHKIYKKYIWAQSIEFFVLVVVLILVITAVILTAQFTTDLNTKFMFGNRSQKICGDNYMEYESARYQLFDYYIQEPETAKKIITIKRLLGASLTLIMLSLILYAIVRMAVMIDLFDTGTTPQLSLFWLLIIISIILLIFLVTFFVKNQKTILAQTYDGSKTEKSMTPLLITVFVLIFGSCMLHIWANSEINDQTPTILLLLITSILTITFMFIININTQKINDAFIKKYKTYSDKINDALCSLGKRDDVTISGGISDGVKVSDRINQLLSRNIKRIHSDKEDPNLDFNGKCKGGDYSKSMYAYLENSHGKELQELPEDGKINKDVTIIRRNMWNMRNENNTMLKPVKTFIQQMRIFVLIMLFIISFIVYHIAYVNYPTTTKLTMVGIVLLFTFVLMYSVII